MKIRFIDNHDREEIYFDSFPSLCDFEHKKDQYVSKSFINKGLKDFISDIKIAKKYYLSSDGYDPLCGESSYLIENFFNRFTKLPRLYKEFSRGVPMRKPVFYSPESNYLIGAGRCLIVGKYFKDMKIDLVTINEKKTIDSFKKVYNFINEFDNDQIILHVEKSKFIDSYLFLDYTFDTIENCITKSGHFYDSWHVQPEHDEMIEGVKDIIRKSDIHNLDDLYNVLDMIVKL